MEQKIGTVEYAQNQVYYAGFDNQFKNDIAGLASQPDGKYNLTHQEDVGKGNAVHELDFGVKAGKVFYNGFATELTDNTTKESLRQFFPAADNVTRIEAVNLLWDKETPRSVLKTYTVFNEQAPENAPKEEKYTRESQWLQLDFSYKTKNDNFRVVGFSDYGLAEKMKEFTFKEVGQERPFKKLLEIVSKGGEYTVTPRDGGEKVYVSSNPAWGTVHIRNLQGDFLEHDQFRTEEALKALADKKAQQGGQHVDNPGQTPARRYHQRELTGGKGGGIHH